MKKEEKLVLEHDGFCNICNARTHFISKYDWFRDHYKCSKCQSIPRQRALVHVLNTVFPDWKTKSVHESSPSISFYRKNVPNYSYSYYYEGIELGSTHNGCRCENLEKLTFADNSFDYIITQDVMEHVFHPDRVLKEVMRVLKNDGAYVFTVPRYRNILESYPRAKLVDGVIEYLREAQYHGNPISENGSLVTWNYGVDFERLCEKWSSYNASCYLIKDRSLGLDGEFLDVFVIKKVYTNLI